MDRFPVVLMKCANIRKQNLFSEELTTSVAQDMKCLQTTDGKQLEGGGQHEKQRSLLKSCLCDQGFYRAKSLEER